MGSQSDGLDLRRGNWLLKNPILAQQRDFLAVPWSLKIVTVIIGP
jgi:hypothetical protein